MSQSQGQWGQQQFPGVNMWGQPSWAGYGKNKMNPVFFKLIYKCSHEMIFRWAAIHGQSYLYRMLNYFVKS